MRSKLLLSGLSALALSACAAPMKFGGPMSAGLEVPPNNSNGTGTVVATLFPTTHALSFTADYKDLTGPATAAHIHGPADPGANAPVVVPAVVTPGTISGSATLTDTQLADLIAGKDYFNIHTTANPGGEIRGWMRRIQ